MKILVEIDDDYIKGYANDIMPDLASKVIKYDIDYIEVGIKPTYDNGSEVLWVTIFIDPSDPKQHYKYEVIKNETL